MRKQFEKMQDKAVEDMTNYGFKRENLQFQYAVDARYQGQAFELQVDFEHIPENGEEITNAFTKCIAPVTALTPLIIWWRL